MGSSDFKVVKTLNANEKVSTKNVRANIKDVVFVSAISCFSRNTSLFDENYMMECYISVNLYKYD